MILGADKARLSKRHGATSVMAYKEMGYLPEAMVNYLVRLGWSFGDQELFARSELIEKFNWKNVQTSAAVFNPDKLLWMNAEYIKTSPPGTVAQALEPLLKHAGLLHDQDAVPHEWLAQLSGLPVLGRNRELRCTFYLTHFTEPAIDWGEARPARLERFQAGSGFAVGDIEVQSFSIPHDARDPVGFCFESQGVRIGIATDLGYVPESIKFHLRRANVLLLEANHDLDMLKVGPYPWSVKQRVMSRVGHLSNLHMSDYLMQELDTCTANLVLGHLSEQNNHPAIVQMVANEALERRGLSTRLSIAQQNTPSEVFQF